MDNHNNELVVGIVGTFVSLPWRFSLANQLACVDYIRTYTWDKKLESWVKESAFLGSGKGEPTIITPKQYKARFRSAMERYFPLVR